MRDPVVSIASNSVPPGEPAAAEAFLLACPQCGTLLERQAPHQLYCPIEHRVFVRAGDVWEFGMSPAGPSWRSGGRRLPDFQVHTFVRRIVQPMEATLRRALTVLDVGAVHRGLAATLARRGHRVASLYLDAPGEPGASSLSVRASLARLPFASDQFDLVTISTAPLAAGYAATLREVLRVLRGSGQFVLLDVPRHRGWPRGEEDVLTEARLRALSATLGIHWDVLSHATPWPLVTRHALLAGRRIAPPFPSLLATEPRTRRLVRAAWRSGLKWRYRHLQRAPQRQPLVETVGGKALIVLPKVFNPLRYRSGAFLAETLGGHLIAPGAHVLDLGTGSGVGAVFAAQWAARVVAVDVNPAAVRCARLNALLHALTDRIDVREGDLFDPTGGGQFDVVLFNPPYFRGVPRDALDRAWRSEDVAERFAAGLRAHLRPSGCALVVLSTDGDPHGFLSALRRHGFAIDVAAEHDLMNEILTMYRVFLP